MYQTALGKDWQRIEWENPKICVFNYLHILFRTSVLAYGFVH